jgi:hypothetical protein
MSRYERCPKLTYDVDPNGKGEVVTLINEQEYHVVLYLGIRCRWNVE